MSLPILVQILMAGLTNAALYTLIGYGFVLTYRVARVFNLAQVASGLLGAYICVFLVSRGLNLYVCALVAIMIAAALGILTERLAINPLRSSKIFGWLMTTLAIDILITLSLTKRWGSEYIPFPPLLGFSHSITVLGGTTDTDKLMAISLATLIIIIVEYVMGRTMWGKAMRAVCFDRQASLLMGLNTDVIVMTTFGLSCALCAISLMLSGPISFLTPSMGFILVIKGFVCAIVGGLQSRRGVIVGALLLGLLEAFGTYFAPAGYRDVFAFGILILVLVFRPEGIFGKIELREV
jgi:branched-chain amino acid transport system permease protein